MRRQATDTWRTAGGLLAAALFLGGCSATHVGDAWQCPVAQGAACADVAEADPAVAASDKARESAVPEPLAPLKPPAPAAATESAVAGDGRGSWPACAGNCDPLAWLAAWFDSLKGPADPGIPMEPASAPPAREPPAPEHPGSEAPDASAEGPRTEETLRTEERIGRIWIAPFVDGGGVYREGHWVRTVLEPARWRVR